MLACRGRGVMDYIEKSFWQLSSAQYRASRSRFCEGLYRIGCSTDYRVRSMSLPGVCSATEVGLEALIGSTLVEGWPLLSVLGDFPMVRLSSGSIVARKSDSRPSPPNRDYPKPSGHCTHSPTRMCLHGHGMSKPRRQGEGSELNWVQTS